LAFFHEDLIKVEDSYSGTSENLLSTQTSNTDLSSSFNPINLIVLAKKYH